MILILIKIIITWLVITFIGTNLIGMIGRGIWEENLKPTDHVITLASTFGSLVIFYFLYAYGGILLMVALALAMLSRVYDLYWEIKILPKALGIAYPVPKPDIRRAIMDKEPPAPWWNNLLEVLTWVNLVIIFVAFYRS